LRNLDTSTCALVQWLCERALLRKQRCSNWVRRNLRGEQTLANVHRAWLLIMATHCNTLQYTATERLSDFWECAPCIVANNDCTLQHTARYCKTLQHTATHCNAMQHTATHRNRICTLHRYK